MGEFIDLFALSRAAPGPVSMLITLIGWKVAGLPGASVATAALFGPSSVLCYVLARIWNAYRGKAWHKARPLKNSSSLIQRRRMTTS